MRAQALVVTSVVLVLVAVSCDRAPMVSLPDDSCDVLSVDAVADATGLKVTSSQPFDKEPVKPDASCLYKTDSRFGTLMVTVAPERTRSTARYWAARERYFSTFPGSAVGFSGVGRDAWLAGGVSLSVLAGDDEYFSVTTQMYAPDGRDVLQRLALAIMDRISADGDA